MSITSQTIHNAFKSFFFSVCVSELTTIKTMTTTTTIIPGYEEPPPPTQEQLATWEAEQRSLAARVIDRDAGDVAHPALVGGYDVTAVPGAPALACAVLVVVRTADGAVVHEETALTAPAAPYAPGFLGYREAPAALRLLARLRAAHPSLVPSVLLCDGNGRLHARRAGLAAHIGVLADIPAVGVAKRLHELPADGITHATAAALAARTRLADTPGAHALVADAHGTPLAALVRGVHSRRLLVVSTGHRVALGTAVRLVLALTRHTHVPEPVRQADLRGRAHVRALLHASSPLPLLSQLPLALEPVKGSVVELDDDEGEGEDENK